MKKKTKLILNETLDKAISPPKKRDLSKLDTLLEEYHEPVKPIVLKPVAASPVEEIKPAEKSPEIGQPVNQKLVDQLTSVVNQNSGQPVNQKNGKLVNQSENYRSRRERRLKGLRLPIQKLKKWELWCHLNKIDFQDAVEQALDWLTSQPVNHVLIDDLEDAGTDDDVLIFYHRWTGNRITKKDKDARELVRRFADDICKIGVAISVYRSKTKINSFKYCVGAIEEASETPVEDKNSYLRYLEKMLLEKPRASDN